MKKIAIAASLAVIGFAATAFVAAPKASTDADFEGVITYSMTVDNPQVAAMLQGSSEKLYLKAGKAKMVLDENMSKMTVFSNPQDPNNPTMLTDAMGNKYQIKMDKSKEKPKAPDIKYVDGTKVIAGYTCNKAQITFVGMDGKSYTTDVYYTTDLPAFSGVSNELNGLKGFPLEYTKQQQGVNITFSATKVSKESVPDDTFTVPTGYKLVTYEEMMQDIQKQMGGGN